MQEFGLSQETVERMRSGELTGGLTEAELALVRYVRKVAEGPSNIEQADVDELTRHGWDSAAIVEALSTALLSAFTNTLAQSMHFEEDLKPMGFEGYF